MNDAQRLIGIAALLEKGEAAEERAWKAIYALRAKGGVETFEVCRTFLDSPAPFARQAAVAVLAQLDWASERGVTVTMVTDVLQPLLASEDSPQVIADMVHAFTHRGISPGLSYLKAAAGHTDSGVRLAVACASPDFFESESIEILAALSRDADDSVRDWATFNLGSLTEEDHPALRAALIERLDDHHDETRLEAIMGLALRQDPRVRPYIEREIALDDAHTMAFDAAEELGDPALVPALLDVIEQSGDYGDDRIGAIIEKLLDPSANDNRPYAKRPWLS